MTLSSYKRHSIHCLHQYSLLSKRQIATTLDLPRTTVKETLDRGLTLERPGFIPKIQDPFSPNTSQRIYDLVRRSLTSRRKTWQAVVTELSLDTLIKKMRR
jgi:IS30 family transposase